ncbi:hypothetical protein ACJQWK_06975 [Exserohilum turcicum]
MCSGTEAPLLALDLISKALEKKGHPPIKFQQEFSAEIEVIKQAFIERNFHPKILFRDVRDFLRDCATTATTAYGAEVDIPTLIDILIAGFVCKDLSRLNNQGKTLEEGGESGDTWMAVYTYVKRFRPSLVLLENVKSEKATWDDVVLRFGEIGYEAAWVFCDTKNYYLPQTRERMYMVAIERSLFGEGVDHAVGHWKDILQKLQRQCSSPYEEFLPQSLTEASGYSAPKSEVDWALCKLRNDHIRSEKRLGILSPVSRRNPNGTVMPPDFADRKFYNSQSSRVHDAIDIAHLENAQKGYDSLYKMSLWDVSQNVDRFRAELGIAPCLTPSGQDFASNRQRTLNGSELLVLQGMPLSNLILANETQRDLQNLAGNAMSTTVIGASLISALISGSKAFRPGSLMIQHEASVGETAVTQVPVVMQPKSMRKTRLKPRRYQLDLKELRRDAKLSEQMCICEGKHLTTRSGIRICSECGHSACTSCAGNPKHVYEETVLSDSRKRSPHDFINRWRPELPERLRFELYPIHRLACEVPASDPILSSYLQLLCEAQNLSRHFCIKNFIREHQYWRITYAAPLASVELRVGRKLEWFVFLRCPPDLPGDSPLRSFLKSPIAHGIVSRSLFDVDWKARFPCSKEVELRISGSNERLPSWRNRLGLQDYKEETVPAFLEVQSSALEPSAITGKYEHLPHCGTASSSLYKKLADDCMFLFLDPDPIGTADHDSFVFSRDHSKKHFNDSRITPASLNPSWRPWHIGQGSHTVNASIADIWLPATLELRPARVSLDVGFLDEQSLGDSCIPECSHALIFLDVVVHPSVAVQKASWILERPRSLPACFSWQLIDSKDTGECPCAPPYPKLNWSVNAKGVATAHEDRRAAATFERAIKQRPPVFHLETSSSASGTRLQVALNVMSLVHRARRRLSGMEQAVKTSWRLVTNHSNSPCQTFAKFKLQSNANDASKTNGVAPTYLRGVQLRSLQWMTEQEVGRKVALIETEEAIHEGLGWRVEAQAETERLVRGGVLADQPSFGKTVATIGLIQNEFDTKTTEAILQSNQSSKATRIPGLLDSVATLVVCPPHIAQQWRSQLEKFLPADQFKSYNVLVIENHADIGELSIEELLASRVVVVSWTLFAQEEYLSELAHVVALPEPSMASRRGVEAWMKRASKEIPSQLSVYKSHGYLELQRVTKELMNERLQQPEFMATLPLKVRHGSAYQSFSTIQSTECIPKAPELLKEKTRSDSRLLPLLHLFQFNRIVVDEYHYLSDTKKTEMSIIATSIKHIAAYKRWLLSGTPALANFSDVNQIASFLGISLGRYCPGGSAVTGSTERSANIDQTDLESFISQTEVMSRQWHEARHMRAQRFLDDFVRQNEAELQHIPCVENLAPVSLDAAHYAVYVELSQHLISQRMQIKKTKKNNADRASRLNESLDNSASAEDALLKSALLFETGDDESGLELLMNKRSQQLQNTESELVQLLSGLDHLMQGEKRRLDETNSKPSAEQRITDLYNHFKKDISMFNWLGDEEASTVVRNMLAKANASPALGFPELVTAKKEQRSRLSKQRLSQLREVSLEFAQRMRSQRFVQSIRKYLQTQMPSQGNHSQCSSPSCAGTVEQSQLYLIPYCGHTACMVCLESRLDDERCVHPGCAAYATDTNLIRMADLGSDEGQTTGQSSGRKLDAVISIINNMPKSDQAIVFAPNEEIISILEQVFKHANIPYLLPSRNKRSAQVIEEFKSNNTKMKKKLLVLNLGSEFAAGANLTNANHIIFVSPLLARSQCEYDSTMAQAIARSRRYGQEKKVYIYHVIAQRTIDVDILEHHQRRSDAITTMNATTQMAGSSSSKKERTRLVRNRKGEMMLVPRSWLVDVSKRKALDIGETPEKFTSLISFSETFERDYDEDE